MRTLTAIAMHGGAISVILDDNSVWIIQHEADGWKRLPDIPQEESNNE